MAQEQLQAKQRGQGGRVHETQTKSVQHKRQVRRRLHTTRPYQERLLNMAEARKEIVTALKFHRASMKQQQEATESTTVQEKKQQTQPPPPPSISSTSISPPPPANHCFYTNSIPYPIEWPTITHNNMSVLPDQTLGLNLNFQGFSDMDASSLYSHHHHQTIDSTTPSSTSILPCFSPSSLSQLSPSSFASSSPPFDPNYNSHLFLNSTSTSNTPIDNHHHHHYEFSDIGDAATIPMEMLAETNMTINSDPTIESSHHQLSRSSSTVQEDLGDCVGLHPRGLDEEQMEEIRTIGNRHQIEWSDTVNLVNSAWWSKFLNTMESGAPAMDAKGLIKEDDDDGSLDQIVESTIPYSGQGITNGYYHPGDDYHFYNKDFFAGIELPCMDIEGFEQGLDEGYWLS